jgi:hypothetical protein
MNRASPTSPSCRRNSASTAEDGGLHRPERSGRYDCHFSYQRLMDYYGISPEGGRVLQLGRHRLLSDRRQDDPIVPTSSSPAPRPRHHRLDHQGGARTGLRRPDLSPAASETVTILEVAGEHADGVVLPVTNVSPSTDAQKAIEARFLERFGTFNALAGNYSWWIYALKAAWETPAPPRTPRRRRGARQVELDDTYVGKVAGGREILRRGASGGLRLLHHHHRQGRCAGGGHPLSRTSRRLLKCRISACRTPLAERRGARRVTDLRRAPRRPTRLRGLGA